MNIKELKKLIKDLPDDLPVFHRETIKAVALPVEHVISTTYGELQILEDSFYDDGTLVYSKEQKVVIIGSYE